MLQIVCRERVRNWERKLSFATIMIHSSWNKNETATLKCKSCNVLFVENVVGFVSDFLSIY